MTLPTNVLLTVAKTGHTFNGANTLHELYEAVRTSIVTKRKLFDVMQESFADDAFCLTKCRRFRVLILHGKCSSFWLEETVLRFSINIYGTVSGKGEIPLLQYFMMTFVFGEISKENDFVRSCLQRMTL